MRMLPHSWRYTVPLAIALLAAVTLIGCGAPGDVAATATTAAPAAAAPQAFEKGGQEEFGPYEPVENWPLPLEDGPDGVKHEGWTWGSTGAVYAESPDRIWIAQRGELPLPKGVPTWTPYGSLPVPIRAMGFSTDRGDNCVEREPRTFPGTNIAWERRWHHVLIVVDRNGKLVQEWPQHIKLFNPTRCGRGPHKIKMNPYDPDKHVWIIDDELHLIHRFTYDGKLEKTFGVSGVKGADANHFNRPTDIAWLPDGTFYISDGYVGTRVAKFDKNDNFLLQWGEPTKDPKNPGPNEFFNPHSVAISADRRVFVADRGHHRMQVFDENGKFLEMWPFGRYATPYFHLITKDQFIWMGDGETNKIVKYDLNGKYLYSWGTGGGEPGQLLGVHQMTSDQEGNFYTAEVLDGRVQKFRPKPGADPAKIVGREAGVASTND